MSQEIALTESEKCDNFIDIKCVDGEFSAKLLFRECPVGERAYSIGRIVAPELTF
jgi:hypothetical protein